MYLSNLSNQQKRLFLSLALLIIKSDGKLEADESQAIISITREMDANISVGELCRDPETIIMGLANGSTQAEKRAILTELHMLCLSNRAEDETESLFLDAVAQAFNIGEREHSDLKALCRKMIEARDAIDAFVRG